MSEDFIQLIIDTCSTRILHVSKGQLTSAQDARFWQASSSLLPGLRPDSDSSRDFGSSEVYPRENWDILKKNEAAHPKSTVHVYNVDLLESSQNLLRYR